MTRTIRPHPARHLVPGALRLDEPGVSVSCLLLAPAPDWVALDLASGALLRSSLSSETAPDVLGAGPLSSVTLRIADVADPFDPSRPEAVALSSASEAQAPRKRAVRRLLVQVTRSSDGKGLLGSVGPSLAYADLEGTRPSVAVLSPARGRVHFAGEDPLTAYFELRDVGHALPVAEGATRWLRSGQIPTSTGGAGRRAHAAGKSRARGLGSPAPGFEASSPVLVAVGLDRPQRGQVRKVILGIVPAV
ncbi:MAG: hypothetical protein ACYCSF_05630 [Acidimicrobiales bacterium]